MGEAFIADLYADWLAHGFATIEKVRTTRPADYLKVIASILPKDVNMNVSPFEHMTDAELEASIKRLLDDVAEREGPGPTEHYAGTRRPMFSPNFRFQLTARLPRWAVGRRFSINSC